MGTIKTRRWIVLILGTLLASISLVFVSVGSAAPLPDAAKGKAAYDRTCAVCHGFEGKGGPIAPPLAKDLVYFKEVGLPVQVAGPLLIQAVRQRTPGSIMPAFGPDKITDAEINDVGEYLWSLSPAPAAVIPPGNAQRGAEPYAANCASCHGPKGEGVAAVPNAPPVAGMAAVMKGGGVPAPVMHALVRLGTRSGALPTMPTFAADKLSDAQLADIAAFIWELPAPAPPPGAAQPGALPRTGDSLGINAVIAGLLFAILAAGVALRTLKSKF